ncbi:hypothetical protein SKAU_G00104450 [Synaphobranchus kaupii]|uniref:Uncharacterized protein n=1 Tax=Synaphobranchus kaupii TaxID=118154 RepID=A0A9Q1FZU4_SYNKA|nr:hypothetical protein SKAU_G00104450 [Synaphobranchus kaupii]
MRLVWPEGCGEREHLQCNESLRDTGPPLSPLPRAHDLQGRGGSGGHATQPTILQTSGHKPHQSRARVGRVATPKGDTEDDALAVRGDARAPLVPAAAGIYHYAPVGSALSQRTRQGAPRERRGDTENGRCFMNAELKYMEQASVGPSGTCHGCLLCSEGIDNLAFSVARLIPPQLKTCDLGQLKKRELTVGILLRGPDTIDMQVPVLMDALCWEVIFREHGHSCWSCTRKITADRNKRFLGPAALSMALNKRRKRRIDLAPSRSDSGLPVHSVAHIHRAPRNYSQESR